MVERITMDKGNNLGYGAKEGILLGRRWGFDILDECDNKTTKNIVVYDRAITKRKRNLDGMMETRYRIAAELSLSKQNNAWHVDLVKVDSRYKGRKLANKLYRFVLKTLGITLMAGTMQSTGGRYIWNTLAKDRYIVVYAKKGIYSKVIDFPKTGKRELVSNMFNLYDTKAAIYAIAAA
jgi:ribosomal protein S18 acetylase RimI-like enzyme